MSTSDYNSKLHSAVVCQGLNFVASPNHGYLSQTLHKYQQQTNWELIYIMKTTVVTSVLHRNNKWYTVCPAGLHHSDFSCRNHQPKIFFEMPDVLAACCCLHQWRPHWRPEIPKRKLQTPRKQNTTNWQWLPRLIHRISHKQWLRQQQAAETSGNWKKIFGMCFPQENPEW